MDIVMCSCMQSIQQAYSKCWLHVPSKHDKQNLRTRIPRLQNQMVNKPWIVRMVYIYIYIFFCLLHITYRLTHIAYCPWRDRWAGPGPMDPDSQMALDPDISNLWFHRYPINIIKGRPVTSRSWACCLQKRFMPNELFRGRPHCEPFSSMASHRQSLQ